MSTKRTTKLMELFHRKEPFLMAMAPCTLYAKISEIAGFECVQSGGAIAAAHHLGIPDGLQTESELVYFAGCMANAVQIPVIADVDHGFGNVLNVRRTVQDFIRAGVAGIHLEDQTFPKRCGFIAGKQVISMEEAVGKYRIAADTKRELDEDFVIIARCDARGSVGGSLEEAIRRLKAYKQAGADVLYLEAPLSIDEVKIARSELDGPLIFTPFHLPELPSLKELKELGIACSWVIGIMEASMIAAWDFAHDFRNRDAQAMRDFEKRTAGHPLAGPVAYHRLVGWAEVAELEKKYLPEQLIPKYDETIGSYDPRQKN